MIAPRHILGTFDEALASLRNNVLMMSSLTERVITLSVLRAIALYTTLIVMAWFALFPILWALSGSLKKESEVTEPTLFPRHPQWSNYGEVFS